MRTRSLLRSLTCVVTLVALGASCVAEETPPASDDLGGGPPATGATTSGGGSGSGSTSGGGGPPLIVDPEDPDPACPWRCSSDLQTVLDCNDVVVDECEDGAGCLDAVCEADACAAAVVSESSVGCEYWALKPDLSIESMRVACFAAVVANTWNTPLTISVSFQGSVLEGKPFIYLPRGQGLDLTYEPYDPESGVAPGEVALLFLAHDIEPDSIYPGCPVTPYFEEEVGAWDTNIGEAFHVATSVPAAAYTIVPYGAATAASTSASLLLPVGRLGTQYFAVNPYARSGLVESGVPSLNILASEDGTTVDILPKVAIVGSPDIPGVAAGEAFTYTLDRGEYLQLSQDEELTGSPIIADKPIAVWGASTAMNIPADTPTADTAHQQLPPVAAMGSEYVVVRHRNRASAGATEETSPVRIVAAVDGTMLSFEPSAPEGAPTSMNAGDWFEFWGTGPYWIRSQDEDHPFYASQYMTSGNFVSDDGREGDPEWVNVVPAAQFLKNYVFFTDPTYPETSVVVVREASTAGVFSDVVLDCHGVLTDWQPIGPYEYTRTRLVQGQFENIGNCSNGVQRMRSDGAFGVTVWGWGTPGTEPGSSLGSYAYPAAIGLRTVNEVLLPPIVVR